MSQKPPPSAKKGGAEPSPFQFDQGESPQPSPRTAAASAASPPLRPTFLGYFLLLAGVALSAYLVRLAPLPIGPRDPAADPQLRTALAFAAEFMRLTEGVILLGPLLLATQWLRGRRQGLTSIEWLWVLSWFGAALLAALAALKHFLPDFNLLSLAPWLWYLIVVPSMAGLGVVLRVLGLFSRRPAPWTHALGLALLIWPVPLLAVVLAVGKYGG